jgi:hypothetical protein
MTINHTPRTTAAASPQSGRARAVLGAALVSGGLALAALGLASATANANPFGSGPLPQPNGPTWTHPHQGWIVPAPECAGGQCNNGRIVSDSNLFGEPLPEPTGPQWIHPDQGLIVSDSNLFGEPLPEPSGPTWTHTTPTHQQ